MKWISVEDRLPDSDRDVVIVMEFYETAIDKRFNDMEFGNYSSNSGWYSWKEGRVIGVTHWLDIPPLPKTPEESK